MAFIRKVKTKSGATAVQVAHKYHGRIIKIEHIGSAHNDDDLQILLVLARQRLRGTQQTLLTEPEPLPVRIRHSVSSVLLDVLTEHYNWLGFTELGDPDFAYLCMARLVEPTSILESLGVLADVGVTGLK